MNLRAKGLQDSRGGFTLLEVVISAALMALILVSAYLCFDAGMRGRKIVDPRVEVFQNARVAMALITADLRSACPLSSDFQFLGTHRAVGAFPADNLDFATHNYTPHRDREGDFCEVSFFLDRDQENGQLSLYRRRNPTFAPDPLQGGSREEIASGLLGMRFEYFDGVDWYDTWGEMNASKKENSFREQPNLSGMPEAVRITLWFDSEPFAKRYPTEQQDTNSPPLVFQTVARLMLADRSQSDSSTGSTGDTAGSDQSTGMPAGRGNQ